MKRIGIFILTLCIFTACTDRKEPPTPPWGAVQDSAGFDLSEIQGAGELIALTISGPDTYYDFGGRHLGVQYLMAERFASSIGTKLRVEVCRDTAELLQRLGNDDGDLAIVRLDADTTVSGWRVGEGKPQLEEALANWYQPAMLAATQEEERDLLTQRRVVRHVFAPMLSRGVISRYDAYFKRYGRQYGWDWRLLAALCYQESTFDPRARSFAGAQGLMQIMPGTADHLGLPRQVINDPERNIEAGARYLKELEGELAAISDHTERQNLAMAAYNGGLHHIRDAMRLAERDHRNPHRWSDVRIYVLRLSQPRYYQDSLVRYGYMRGEETANYVDHIRQRYQKYKRSAK